MSFSFDPAVIALIALALGLYARAVHVLGARGYRVPAGQQAAWYAAMAITAIGLLSPIDTLGSDLLSAHMAQHLLIADLSAPLMLIGIRSPVYAFLLPRPLLVPLARRRGLRRAFRWLRRPLVAIPVWIVILYGWHLAFAFDAALRDDLVHALQHESFLLGSRLAGMFLGMAFIIMRSPAYGAYYGDAARDHGLSPLTDQQVAGGMMLGLDLLVMLGSVAFFFYRSAQEHDRSERAAAATG